MTCGTHHHRCGTISARQRDQRRVSGFPRLLNGEPPLLCYYVFRAFLKSCTPLHRLRTPTAPRVSLKCGLPGNKEWSAIVLTISAPTKPRSRCEEAAPNYRQKISTPCHGSRLDQNTINFRSDVVSIAKKAALARDYHSPMFIAASSPLRSSTAHHHLWETI